MASACEMVAKIREALMATPAGVVSITFEGRTQQYDRKELREELLFWQQQAQIEAGRPSLIPVEFC